MCAINDDPDRISAINAGGHEIAGAFTPPHHPDVWKLYLTELTDTHTQRWHPVVASREGALEWVEAIAALYTVIEELKAELAERRL